MPGVGPPSSHRREDTVATGDAFSDGAGGEASESELLLDPSQFPFPAITSPLELMAEEPKRGDGSWGWEADLQGCARLERRWLLWHEFMKGHAHLDAWLRFAEQSVGSLNSAHVTYSAAKEELRRFERLRSEAASQLVQLDDLTQKNRTLTRLFQGAMQARLLASARECGRRWDDVNAKLESAAGRLQLFVSEWEEFEEQREELALCLADMDVRLTEIDHLTGNTCEKLRRLQSFQECVCENSGLVNGLLHRGEALIQSCDPADAQRVERRLLELLRSCSRVYNNIARTHTRLLSMRLVFEDDWILSQATDSGCPSETLPEDEGTFEIPNVDCPSVSNRLQDLNRFFHPTSDLSSDGHHHPDLVSSLSSPSHEHMGLEWDPSVDIGRSVSHDDADSSYFSASTGQCNREDLKRWSFLSSPDSRCDITADITGQEVDMGLGEWSDHAHCGFLPPLAAEQDGALLYGDQWATSTPERKDGRPVNFDGGRVKAWLRVQSSTSPERAACCSKAVQTDGEEKLHKDGGCVRQLHRRLPAPPTSSHDLETKACSDCVTPSHQPHLQAEEETSCCDEDEHLLPERRSSSPRLPPVLLRLLLAAALALLGGLVWVITEPPCNRSNRMSRTFHLALRYVNGPPPT